tara:strand:- start:473 stop:859 length:387 start_codon:yes stop_codon:yes gene_type:complete
MSWENILKQFNLSELSELITQLQTIQEAIKKMNLEEVSEMYGKKANDGLRNAIDGLIMIEYDPIKGKLEKREIGFYSDGNTFIEGLTIGDALELLRKKATEVEHSAELSKPYDDAISMLLKVIKVLEG